MKAVTINIFTFSELSEKAQDMARLEYNMMYGSPKGLYDLWDRDCVLKHWYFHEDGKLYNTIENVDIDFG